MKKRLTKREKEELKLREELSFHRFQPLKVSLVNVNLLPWAINEIREFISLLEPFVGTDNYHTASPIQNQWYDWVHEKLHVFDFVNGEPTENTWEKRPKAKFWWEIYGSDPQYWFPCYDHHCSSNQRKEQMLCLLNDMIMVLERD